MARVVDRTGAGGWVGGHYAFREVDCGSKERNQWVGCSRARLADLFGELGEFPLLAFATMC